MTKEQEALKLSLEALEPFSTPHWAGTGVDKANAAITAIKEALAQPAQEPLAWGVFEGNLHDMFFSRKEAEYMAYLKGSPAEVRPLYTAPPVAQPAQEPVAWSTDIEFDDDTEIVPPEEKGRLGTAGMTIPLYTTPQQRPWVGLTIYEMDDAFDESMKVRPKEASNAETRRLFAHAIEAKLKEKNT
jgi:hypothetical protein